MTAEYQSSPVDTEAAEQLAAEALRLALVDTSDEAAFSIWYETAERGFHSSASAPETLAADIRGVAYRRTTGVWDASSADAAAPVGTVSSFPTELTVPGHTSVTAWAISAVTVAPTHRRRGIARALLSAELRTAHRLGMPLAILTVSEATIYGRFGFAPAAMAAVWQISTRRGIWTGPTPSGRVHLIPMDRLREQRAELIELVRLNVPGEIEHWDTLWDRLLGYLGDDKERPKQLRAVRYDDEAGEPQGFAVYRLVGEQDDFAAHDVDVVYLAAATDDAYAALWRYLFELDLVTTVTAQLRSVDEPFAWQFSDPRSVRRTKQSDHLWVRILDVPAALAGRRYRSPGVIALTVSDPMGFAQGRFLLTIGDDGTGSVSTETGSAGIPDDAAAVTLSVNDLSALYLGGVSAVTLVRAGRIREGTPGAAAAVDLSFQSEVAPWLSVWF